MENPVDNTARSLGFARDDEETRGSDSQWHRGFELGALREERNEAVLTGLSRESYLNRLARPIR